MKKYFVLILAFLLNINIVNAATGYVPGKNLYLGGDGAKVVIIYKGTDRANMMSDDIYYIAQSDSSEGFSNLEMLMKLDPPAGKYTVETNLSKTTFVISDAEAFVSGATEMKFLGAQKQSDSSYSVAFGLGAKNSYSDTSKLTMIIGEKAYTTDMTRDSSIINWLVGPMFTENEQGKKELMFAIQIDGVGESHVTTDESGSATPNFALYFK